MKRLVLPGDDKRLLIMGRTGTGKSQAGAWHLSQRSFHAMPWIIFDPKHDELFEQIGALEFPWKGRLKLPRKPGLYKFSPIPTVDDKSVEDVLRAICEQRNMGLYVDEGYSIPKASPAFRRIQTQGRSMRVPSITLTQRPVFVDRFTISEADFFQQFHLQDFRDRDTVSSFVGYDPHRKLPEFHSHWYDVKQDLAVSLAPVPDADTILETFHHRLGLKRRRRQL